MESISNSVIFCLILSSVASTRAIPFPLDYYSDEIAGNAINTKDIASFQTNAITNVDSGSSNIVAIKRDPELFVGGQKRNIISALRMAKIRRSKPVEKVEDKMRFSPVLSVDAIGNLGEFFDNLATNLQTMESRNLMPNQLRLLGENENRPKDFYGFINSARVYQSPNHIRRLNSIMPDSHRNSNFYDPVLTRIGLGRK